MSTVSGVGHFTRSDLDKYLKLPCRKNEFGNIQNNSIRTYKLGRITEIQRW